MKVTSQIFGVLLIALAVTACKNTEYKKTKDGYPYKVFSTGKGDTIMPGNVVRYHMTNNLGDSLLGTTYGTEAQWMPIPKDGEQNPMVALLIGARKNDSILIIRSVDSLLAKNPQGAQQDSFLVANKGKDLKTIIKIVEVYKDEASARAIFDKESMDNFFKDPANAAQRTKDEAEIEAYLKTTGGTAVRRSPWGAYIQTLTPGNGQKANMGDFMMLRYSGKNLSGIEFDSNTKPGDELMPFQVGAGGTIPGFEDGVKQLTKGEKAIVLIPSVIGYGAQGREPKIQPNQNLLFEIEVVDITDKQPAPPAMPQQDTTRN